MVEVHSMCESIHKKPVKLLNSYKNLGSAASSVQQQLLAALGVPCVPRGRGWGEGGRGHCHVIIRDGKHRFPPSRILQTGEREEGEVPKGRVGKHR